MSSTRRFAAVAITAALLLAGCATTQRRTETTVLDGARLFDGKSVVEDARLVLRDGRVVAAGPAAETAAPPGARRIDLSGRTIIPGLIAAHSHVGMVDGLDQGGHNYTREVVARDLAQFQRYGVVAVNALGMNRPLFHPLRTQWRSGAHGGADLYGAGPGVGAVEGAPPASMRPQPDQVERPRTPQESAAAVDRMADAGVDMVKIWVDDLSGTVPRLSPEVYQAAIERAHERGLKIAAHVHDLVDAKGVLAAGVDVIGHGVRDQPVDQAFIDAMRERGAWYVPTININEGEYLYAEHPEWLDDPFVRGALSPALAEKLRDPEWRRETLAAAAGATTCSVALTLCGGGTADAFCANTETDNAHCGACGNACAAGEVCSDGACATTCSDALTLCGGGTAAAYCANTETDNAHCGACGNTCGPGTACLSGACATTCGGGLTHCDDGAGNAFCADLQNDPANCGGCGVACASEEVCTSGSCERHCGVGQTRCAAAAGGAEYCSDTSSDRNNCGACGNECADGHDCAGGSCQPCTPTVVPATGSPPSMPTGMRVDCYAGPNDYISVTCPVVACANLTYWAFSYSDNRSSFGVVGFDESGAIFKQGEHSGARYLWDITVDGTNETATFWGQGAHSVTLGWSHFHTP